MKLSSQHMICDVEREVGQKTKKAKNKKNETSPGSPVVGTLPLMQGREQMPCVTGSKNQAN